MWSEKQLKQLKKQGHIQDYHISENKNPKNMQGNRGNKASGDKQKDWILLNLQYWCNQKAVSLEQEHKFHPDRKWRFDYAIPALMIAIEYEGVFSEKSRHTTVQGFTKDTEKYNQAQRLGWKVYRYTACTYKNLLNDLNN